MVRRFGTEKFLLIFQLKVDFLYISRPCKLLITSSIYLKVANLILLILQIKCDMPNSEGNSVKKICSYCHRWCILHSAAAAVKTTRHWSCHFYTYFIIDMLKLLVYWHFKGTFQWQDCVDKYLKAIVYFFSNFALDLYVYTCYINKLKRFF